MLDYYFSGYCRCVERCTKQQHAMKLKWGHLYQQGTWAFPRLSQRCPKWRGSGNIVHCVLSLLLCHVRCFILTDPQNSILQSLVYWYLWALSERTKYYFAWKQGESYRAKLIWVWNNLLWRCRCIGIEQDTHTHTHTHTYMCICTCDLYAHTINLQCVFTCTVHVGLLCVLMT